MQQAPAHLLRVAPPYECFPTDPLAFDPDFDCYSEDEDEDDIDDSPPVPLVNPLHSYLMSLFPGLFPMGRGPLFDDGGMPDLPALRVSSAGLPAGLGSGRKVAKPIPAPEHPASAAPPDMDQALRQSKWEHQETEAIREFCRTRDYVRGVLAQLEGVNPDAPCFDQFYGGHSE
jgi:hypothetical protein